MRANAVYFIVIYFEQRLGSIRRLVGSFREIDFIPKTNGEILMKVCCGAFAKSTDAANKMHKINAAYLP